MAPLWEAGKTLREAVSELRPRYNLTVRVFHGRFCKKFPFGCWVGRAVINFVSPKMGDPMASFVARTSPLTAEEMQQINGKNRLLYNFNTRNRSAWMLERVLRLNPDPYLTAQIQSLLVADHGHMFHVSLPAPGASLSLSLSLSACVSYLCVLVLLLFIVIYLDFLLFIYLLGVSLCGVTADAWASFRWRRVRVGARASSGGGPRGLDHRLVYGPHATLVALRTDRPARPTPGCVC